MNRLYRRFGKRMADVALAGGGLVALSPVLAATAVMVRIKLGSPVIFKQVRPGLGGRLFTLYKFRTMTDERDPNGALRPSEDRLTPFGRLLRSTSLDELPGLWNVLRGDMSLVGPRPLLVEYLELYSPHQARRHEVRPGVTGWAQVHGRNATSWEERLDRDVWYVTHLSLRLDCRILAKTLTKVLRRTGVTPADGEIMARFQGTAGSTARGGATGGGEPK